MSSMKLGVVAEFTDRASKKMRKMLRFNKRMEKINKAQTKQVKAQTTARNKVARATENSVRSMGTLQRLTRGVSAAAMGMSRGIVTFSGHVSTAIRRVNTLRKSLDLADRSRRLVKRGAGLARDGAGRLARGAVVGAGLAAGATGAAAAAANTVIGPAAQVEQYQTILETTEGSAAKAQAALQWVTDFAVKTPYELETVMESFTRLRAYGLDPTNGLLRTLGDTSAAMGKPIMQAVEAMADAVTGENERLKEFGIKARKAGKYFYYEYTQNGVTKVAKALASDRAAIQKTLTGIFDARYGGSMDRLSKTWNGMVANMMDMWFKFRLMIADAGVFDWAKGKLKAFLDLLNEMKANGQLEELAKTISTNIIATLEAAWEFGKGLVWVFREIGSGLSWAAEMLGGWNRLAMVFVALPLIGTIMSVIAGFAQLATGIAFIVTGLAGLSLPVLGVIVAVTALAAAAWLIYDNWDVVVQWFADAWSGIKDSAAAAWDWFKTNLSWHPLALIANNWGAITDWFQRFWAKLVTLGNTAWDGFKTLLRWSPLGLIVANWGNISAWFGSFFSDLGGKVKAGWEAIKSAASFTWPTIPDMDLPSFETIRQSVLDFFSLSWLPKLTWPDLSIPSMQDLFGNIDEDAMRSALAAVFDVITAFKLEFPFVATTKTLLVDFFSLNWLPDWTWPEIPMPELPDIGALISDTAAKANRAWNSLTNIFSDEDPIAIAARDPASIERATQATERLKVSMQAVPQIIADVNSVLAAVDFTHHGRRMMETIAAGMRARANLLVNEIRRVTQQVRDHLPSSPARTGPLSDIHRLKFSETMAQSIKPAPMVKAMRRVTAATLAAATIASPTLAAPIPLSPGPAALSVSSTTGGSGGTASSGGQTVRISFNPRITIQGGGDDVRDQVMEALEDVIPELARMLKQAGTEDERLEF